MDENIVKNLRILVEALTHSGLNTLDEDVFKQVKKICKSSPSYIKVTYDFIISQLKKKNSQIRFLAFKMCIELFARSALFRQYIVKDLKLVLKLAAEIDSKVVLPPPKCFANKLKDLAIQTLYSWMNKFGEQNKELKIACNYLKTCKNINFEARDTRNEIERQRENENERKLKRMFEDKKKKLMEEVKSYETEIEETITSLLNCLRLLLPTPEEFFIPEESTTCNDNLQAKINSCSLNVGEEDISQIDIRHLGIMSDYSLKLEIKPNEKIKIMQTEENVTIIQNAKDCVQLINNRYLPVIKKWCHFLCKYSSENNNELKKILDLRQKLQNILDKYKALNIEDGLVIKSDSSEDDTDFEEVKKEGYEDFVEFVEEDFSNLGEESTKGTCVKQEYKKENESKVEDTCFSSSSKGESSQEESILKDRKSKLLEIAPVLPFDIDLYHWEDEKLTVPTLISTQIDVDKFWGCADSNEFHEIPNPEGVAALRTRVIEFTGKFEPVKWTCRAPLPSGKLCPRKDRYKCPFHGKIVPRDECGNCQDNIENKVHKHLVNGNSCIPDWQDPMLLAEIKEATGINLKMPEHKGKVKKSKYENLTHKQMKTSAAAMKIAKIKNYSGLIDVVKKQNNSYARLSKKVFNRSSIKRVSAALNKLNERKLNEKFGDCFNY